MSWYELFEFGHVISDKCKAQKEQNDVENLI